MWGLGVCVVGGSVRVCVFVVVWVGGVLGLGSGWVWWVCVVVCVCVCVCVCGRSVCGTPESTGSKLQ